MPSLGIDLTTFGEGQDGPGLDPYFRTVSEGAAVVESVARSWLDPDTIDLRILIDKPLSPRHIFALVQRLKTAALDDERVDSCDVSVTASGRGASATLNVESTIFTTDGTALEFVLDVSKVGAALILKDG